MTDIEFKVQFVSESFSGKRVVVKGQSSERQRGGGRAGRSRGAGVEGVVCQGAAAGLFQAPNWSGGVVSG